LNLEHVVAGIGVTSQDIAHFLNTLPCSNEGKHAYYRALKAFYNRPYSLSSRYSLNPQYNPIPGVDPPKVEKRILPSQTRKQVDYLIEKAVNTFEFGTKT
jgi:hypothetical protein